MDVKEERTETPREPPGQLGLFASPPDAPRDLPTRAVLSPTHTPALPITRVSALIVEPQGISRRVLRLSPDQIMSRVDGTRHADPALLASVQRFGVWQPVLVRACPAVAGARFALVAGARRLDAVRQLACRTRDAAAPGDEVWRVPAIVCDADDLRAAVIEFADDDLHESLTAWGRAVALARVDVALTATLGREPTVRELARAVSGALGTVAELRRIAAISTMPGVLAAAGLLGPDGTADVVALGLLTHRALLELSRATCDDNAAIAAERVTVQRAPQPACVPRVEPSDTGLDSPAATSERVGSATAGASLLPTTAGFALRLSRPLDQYTSTEAAAYVARLVRAAAGLTAAVEPCAVVATQLPGGDTAYLIRVPSTDSFAATRIAQAISDTLAALRIDPAATPRGVRATNTMSSDTPTCGAHLADE